MRNEIGRNLRVRVYGASHAPEIGVEVSGAPAGLRISPEEIQRDLDRRKPGGPLASERKESDKLEVLEGIRNGKATGGLIRMRIRNRDVDSSTYGRFRNTPRPGHVDYIARMKYGEEHDLRGGGIHSGRMTACLVMAGGIAKAILAESRVTVHAKLAQVGKATASSAMTAEVLRAKAERDSIGGLIECRVDGLPIGVGEPLFDSLESALAHSLFSIPAVKGVEFGSGFSCVRMRGSEHNDPITLKQGKIATITNNSGGIIGGISNGMPVIFRVAIKPTSSIAKVQRTVDLCRMKATSLKIEGRHDPCIAIRVPPIVEAVAALAIADMLLELSRGIDGLRLRISGIDELLASLIRERMELAVQIGKLKKQKKHPVRDAKREREVLEKWRLAAQRNGLSATEMQSICQLLMKMSKQVQEEVEA